MKNRLFLAYALILGLIASLLTAAYMLYHYKVVINVFFKSTEVHLWIQFLLSLFLMYCLYHFIRIIKTSATMRKAAREQREAKSKRIEMMIFGLMLALVFFSLFYTVPFRYYFPTTVEYSVYVFNSLFQLLLLISLISAHAENNETIIKMKQKYAATGAVSGLLLFYTYFQLVS